MRDSERKNCCLLKWSQTFGFSEPPISFDHATVFEQHKFQFAPSTTPMLCNASSVAFLRHLIFAVIFLYSHLDKSSVVRVPSRRPSNVFSTRSASFRTSILFCKWTNKFSSSDRLGQNNCRASVEYQYRFTFSSCCLPSKRTEVAFLLTVAGLKNSFCAMKSLGIREDDRFTRVFVGERPGLFWQYCFRLMLTFSTCEDFVSLFDGTSVSPPTKMTIPREGVGEFGSEWTHFSFDSLASLTSSSDQVYVLCFFCYWYIR